MPRTIPGVEGEWWEHGRFVVENDDTEESNAADVTLSTTHLGTPCQVRHADTEDIITLTTNGRGETPPLWLAPYEQVSVFGDGTQVYPSNTIELQGLGQLFRDLTAAAQAAATSAGTAAVQAAVSAAAAQSVSQGPLLVATTPAEADAFPDEVVFIYNAFGFTPTLHRKVGATYEPPLPDVDPGPEDPDWAVDWTDGFDTYGASGVLPAPWTKTTGHDWQVYSDGTYSVAFSGFAANGAAKVAWRSVASPNHRVVATYRTSTLSNGSIGGVIIRGTADTKFLGFELVKTSAITSPPATAGIAESKAVIYKRSGGSDIDIANIPMPALAYDTEYELDFAIYAGKYLVAKVDGVVVLEYTLTGPEEAEFTGSDAGIVNFLGTANYLDVTTYTDANDAP